MATLDIISSATCPYAARSRLALIEKGVEFTLTEIDLDDKPDWFRAISPYGKVPVVRHGATVVWESSVINEFLEELFPEPPLLPADPAARATARIWIDYANVRFAPFVYKFLLAQADADRRERETLLTDSLRFMDHEGLGKLADGPYWLGADLTLVDLSFWPHLERFCALEHYRGFTIPDDCNHLLAWRETMLRRPSVAALHPPDALLIENWRKYAENTSTGVTAAEMRRF